MQADGTFASMDEVLALPSVPYSKRISLPDQPGLYFAVVNGDQVAYIGAAKRSLRRRWKEHNKRRRLEMLGSVEIAYLLMSDLHELDRIERQSIRAMRPAFNFLHVEGAVAHWRQHYTPKPTADA